MSKEATLRDLLKYTCSQVSEDGLKHLESLEYPQMSLFGLDHALANHLATQENGKGKKMKDTFGPNSSGSLESANLTLSLANKLKRQLDSVGLMEYSQTWKEKVTPAGRRYWEHIASTRHISGKDCTGWPTPRENDFQNDTPNCMAVRGKLNHMVPRLMMGWNTPRATDGDHGGPNQTGGSLPADAAKAGWPTPTVQDSNCAGEADHNRMDNYNKNMTLTGQAKNLIFGQTPSGSLAPMEKHGVLNPRFSLWLQGYREEWACCGEAAMQSVHKRRRNSSKHILK